MTEKSGVLKRKPVAEKAAGFFRLSIATLKPEKSPTVEDGDFVAFQDVPVFKAHTTRDGHEMDERALRRICQRCNDRIRDTGDFAPIVLRHTDDEGERDPEVVGFAGPYRLGTVGRLEPKPAILATLRIFREDANKVRKYPRLSVEYWADESDPTNGYFDPISLLGAETPELDLGIRYAKDNSGLTLMRYAKVTRFQAAPGGSNTFVPGVANADEKKTQFAKGADMAEPAFSPEAIQQLIEALRPVIAEEVTKLMPMASANPLASPDAMGPDGAPAATAPGADMGLPMDPDGDGDALPGVSDGDADDLGEPGADMDDMGDDEDPDELGDVEGLEDDDEDEDDGAPKADHYAKLCSMADAGDDEGASKYVKDLDDDSRAAVAARLDGEDRDDVRMKLQKYMAIDSSPAAPMVAQYQKERRHYLLQYRKERAARLELQEKYQKLRGENRALLAEKTRAVRYQKLGELVQEGYVLDEDEELEDCKLMSDGEFEKHVGRIRSKYQRIPRGSLPVPKSPYRDGTSDEAKRQRYAKQAGENVLKARERGQDIDFKVEYERLLKEDKPAS